MITLIRYFLLLVGYVYGTLLFIIHPLSPIIDYDEYGYLTKLQFIVNSSTAISWISLMFVINIKKLKKFINLSFVLSYATMWFYFIVNHVEHNLIIVLFHLLGFAPLYIAYKLAQREERMDN